ncbi:MAG TPA: hypothetical protein VL651_10005 [Bacteroidia bacterium]|jgi:hypothetical protein|nr:hypothetical protein [Bacteroidia bacterium]
MKKHLFLFLLFICICRLNVKAQFNIIHTNSGDSVFDIVPLKDFVNDSGVETGPAEWLEDIYYPEKVDRIVVHYCNAYDSSFESFFMTIPEQFYIKQVFDTLKHRSIPDGGELPYDFEDSLKAVDYPALESYYKNHPELRTDTLLFASYETTILYSTNIYYQLKSSCEYHLGIKDGDELNYYSLDELKGICLVDNMGFKSAGKWKNGKKTGKWTLYSPNGEINAFEKWHNGKLKRSWKAK